MKTRYRDPHASFFRKLRWRCFPITSKYIILFLAKESDRESAFLLESRMRFYRHAWHRTWLRVSHTRKQLRDATWNCGNLVKFGPFPHPVNTHERNYSTKGENNRRMSWQKLFFRSANGTRDVRLIYSQYSNIICPIFIFIVQMQKTRRIIAIVCSVVFKNLNKYLMT